VARPSPAILGSIALHAGVAALFLVGWATNDRVEIPPMNAVPVSIVSDVVIEAAAPDNPQPELSPEDGSTAPVETPPEPVPPEPTPPTPRPTPPPPRPSPTPMPRPPEKARPTPPRPQPPRPATQPRRDEPTLDLDALAGPRRQTQNQGRPAAGQQGRGNAPQATGPQVTAIFNQVYDNWNLTTCSIPGGDELRIQVELTLSTDGRITRGPTLVNPQTTPVYRASADSALRALRQTAPFEVPQGFSGGAFRPIFVTERACANR
jgi:outer membrane biosynthesis protein TonB